MSRITTHVLDVSKGCPAKAVPVTLERQSKTSWEIVGTGTTDDDGRLRDLLGSEDCLQTGNYRLTFDTETYFAAEQIRGFYPQVTIVFTVSKPEEHFHVPLLLSPFGYSTYRGS